MNKRIILLACVVIVPLLLTAILGLRQAWAGREVADDWANFSAQAPALATTTRLEIIPLYEAAVVAVRNPATHSGAQGSAGCRGRLRSVVANLCDRAEIMLTSLPRSLNVQACHYCIQFGDLPGQVFQGREVAPPAQVCGRRERQGAPPRSAGCMVNDRGLVPRGVKS